MQHIGDNLKKIEQNIKLDGFDRISAAGFTMYPNVIQNDPNLELGEKAVYAQFLQYAWHHNYCFPSQALVSKNLGISQSRVSEFVTGLQKKGLLTIERRGQGKTNYYILHATIKRKAKAKE